MDERQKAIIDGHYTTYIYYLIYTLTLCAKENYVYVVEDLSIH